MGFFQSIFGGQSQKRETATTTTTSTSSGVSQGESAGSYKSREVRVDSAYKSLMVSAVYHAVELKAKTIGSMLMEYQRKDPAGGNFIQCSYGDGAKLNWLLQKRPNPIDTGSELFQIMSRHREMFGNAFVYIERDELSRPLYLWPAFCGGYNPIAGTYTLSYSTDHGIVNVADAPASDVIHWRNTFRTRDGYMGIPTHVYAIQSLSQIATQKELATEIAAKGGRVKLMISEEKPSGGAGTLAFGMYNKDKMQQYADEIEDRIYVKDVTALRGLDKVIPISMTAQDMQMMDMLGISLDDCARFYSIPRPLLMLDTNSHYNDYTNATMEYLGRTIAPLARELEDLFDTKFLTLGDFGKRRFHMCELPLMRMDLERQAKVDQLRLGMGWTVNEIRAQYDMPAIENGDRAYLSTNLAELGSEKLSGSEPKPTDPKPDNTDGDEKDQK